MNTSRLGQDIIKFEQASSTSASPSATSSSSTDPLIPFSTNSPLNPLNPDSPLSGLGDLLDPIVGNLTDAVNDGIGTLINSVVEGVVESAGLVGVYYAYLGSVCTSNITEKSPGTSVVIECKSWGDVSESESSMETVARVELRLTCMAGIGALASGIQSSVVIGRTRVSVPLLAKLTSSVEGLSGLLALARKTIMAFVIISSVASGMSAISTVPGIVFRDSRLLVYLNIAWPMLANTLLLLAALILTVLVVGVARIIGDLGEAVGVEIGQGRTALLLLWLAWLFSLPPSMYWGAVWFVEVRQNGLVRRARSEDEKGDWTRFHVCAGQRR